jgi:hypothetical protein
MKAITPLMVTNSLGYGKVIRETLSLHPVENSPLKKLWTCCMTDYGHSIMSYRFFFRESSSDSKTVFNIKRKSIISMANERGSFF